MKLRLDQKTRVKKIIRLLKRYHPKAKCALEHKGSFQLLAAVMLSAQCTDKRVNKVTQTLFKKYSGAADLAAAKINILERDIHSTGFFRAKAKNLKAAAKKIQKEFNGQVPPRLQDLITLPGVGRKTALAVLGAGFGLSRGVVVDTHVLRLSYRLGLTKAKNPLKAERDLQSLLDKKHWIYFSHALIEHGRGVCKARRPRCQTCFLDELCPKKDVKNPAQISGSRH